MCCGLQGGGGRRRRSPLIDTQSLARHHHHYNILYCRQQSGPVFMSVVRPWGEGSLRAHFRVRLSLSLSHKRGEGRRKYFVTCRIEFGTAARNTLWVRQRKTQVYFVRFSIFGTSLQFKYVMLGGSTVLGNSFDKQKLFTTSVCFEAIIRYVTIVQPIVLNCGCIW